MFQKSTGYMTGHKYISYRKIRSKASVDRFLRNNLFYKNGFPGELISDGSAIGKGTSINHVDGFLGKLILILFTFGT